MYIQLGSYWDESTGTGVSYGHNPNTIELLFEAKFYGHGKYLGFLFFMNVHDMIACRYLINIVCYRGKQVNFGKIFLDG